MKIMMKLISSMMVHYLFHAAVAYSSRKSQAYSILLLS